MYTKIKRESSEKETQKNLKTLLNIVNNSSCYRCYYSNFVIMLKLKYQKELI